MSLDYTNMRLTIRVNGRIYYDIGLRRNSNLSEKVYISGGYRPRYLEDFIKFYGKEDIEIVSYGKLKSEKEYIDRLLSN